MDPDTLGVKIEDDDEDKALDEGLLAAKDLLKKRQRQKREASEHNSSGDLKKKEHVKTDNSAQQDAKDKVVGDEEDTTPVENGEEEEEPPTPPPIEKSPPPEEPDIGTSKEKGDKSKRTGKLPATWEKKESPEPDQEEQKVERKVGRLKFEAKKEREKGPVDIPKQETIDDFRNARQMLRKRAPPDESKKTAVQSEGLGFSVVK